MAIDSGLPREEKGQKQVGRKELLLEAAERLDSSGQRRIPSEMLFGLDDRKVAALLRRLADR